MSTTLPSRWGADDPTVPPPASADPVPTTKTIAVDVNKAVANWSDITVCSMLLVLKLSYPYDTGKKIIYRVVNTT